MKPSRRRTKEELSSYVHTAVTVQSMVQAMFAMLDPEENPQLVPLERMVEDGKAPEARAFFTAVLNLRSALQELEAKQEADIGPTIQ